MDDNSLFKTINGVTYTSDMRMLVGCAYDREGEVVIPEGVEIIKEESFRDCHIRSVVMPDSMRHIHPRAFAGCRNLEHVDFGNGITDIGYGSTRNATFMGCDNLKSVEIPRQVLTIDDGVFMSTGLEEVIFHEGLEEIGDSAFTYCNRLKTLSLPKSLNYFGEQFTHSINEFKLKSIPQNFICSIICEEWETSYCSKRIITINVNDRNIFLSSSMEKTDRDKVNTVFNAGYITDDFIHNTYQYVISTELHYESMCCIYDDALKNGRESKVPYLRKAIQPKAFQIINWFLEKQQTEKAIMVIRFGFLSRDEVKYLLKKTDNPTLRAYLISSLPDTKENNISLQI